MTCKGASFVPKTGQPDTGEYQSSEEDNQCCPQSDQDCEDMINIYCD